MVVPGLIQGKSRDNPGLIQLQTPKGGSTLDQPLLNPVQKSASTRLYVDET